MTLFINTEPRPIDIPGSRFAGGVTIRSLLQQNSIDPATVSFVNVTRDDGGQIPLPRSEFGAVIIDNGTTTRFVRNGRDTVSATAATGPLQISVNGGDISVVASVDRADVEAGTGVTFSARVRFAPPGAQLIYEWDFGDGSLRKTGASVRHVYKLGSDYQARVTVRGSGGSTQRCATSCIGHDDVDVSVGDPPQQPPATPGAGSGTGDPTGPGSSTGTGGGGQGGSGGTAAGSGSDPTGTEKPAPAAKPKTKPKPKPKPKKPFGVTISGVLINDPGVAVKKLPSGTAPGAPAGPRRTAGGDSPDGIELPLTGLLAMAFISIGALRERRGVRLRVA